MNDIYDIKAITPTADASTVFIASILVLALLILCLYIWKRRRSTLIHVKNSKAVALEKLNNTSSDDVVSYLAVCISAIRDYLNANGFDNALSVTTHNIKQYYDPSLSYVGELETLIKLGDRLIYGRDSMNVITKDAIKDRSLKIINLVQGHIDRVNESKSRPGISLGKIFVRRDNS